MAHKPSTTATLAALARVALTNDTRFAEPGSDAVVAQLLSASERLLLLPGVRNLALGVMVRRFPGAYGLIYARGRVFDRVVRDDVSAGAEQVVILGAGFDTRGIRLASDGVITFEVDRAETQAVKKQRLARARFDTSLMRFVDVDFNHERLVDKLVAHGFERGARTVVIAEGLTPYLKPPAIYAMLGFMTGECAKGSVLAFDYIDAVTADGTTKDPAALSTRAHVLKRGEPFMFGIHPGSVREHLEPMGFHLERDFTPQELEREARIPVDRYPELAIGRFYGLTVLRVA